MGLKKRSLEITKSKIGNNENNAEEKQKKHMEMPGKTVRNSWETRETQH